uniref:Uncharacterized protein n=1 Tax=Salix viminalis TaxID=40686 RepID=A0A6N2M624_SALVM
MTKDRDSQPGRDTKSTIVLAVECLKGSSKADEWTGDMLQTGDIVEEILIGSGSSSSGSGSIGYKAPFKNGKRGVQKILHNSFKNKETSIVVRVRRGRDGFAELHACVVPESGYKNKYVLRSIEDPNYAFGFTDRSEAECSELQGILLIPTSNNPLIRCCF